MLDFDSEAGRAEEPLTTGKGVLRDVMLAYAGAFRWLERDQRPRLVVAARGRVAWSNAAAQRWLVPPMPVSIIDGCLSFSGPLAVPELGELLQSLDAAECPMPIADDSGGIRLLFGAQACEPPDDDHFFVSVSLVREAAFVVETGLAAHFGLTSAEAHVIDAIVSLKQPVAIAERLGLSINTVRTHIRRAYVKMGIHTQAELVRLCLAFADA